MGPLRAPRALDVALAAALAVWWIAEVRDLDALRSGSLVLCVAPLAWRHDLPLWTAVLVSAGFVLSTAEAEPPEPLAQLLAMLLAAYSVAVHASDRRALVAGGAAALAGGLAAGLIIGDDVAFILVLVGAALGAGTAVRRLRGRSSELEERAARLDERARTAAAEERERIARELHDVVSHSVSLMVVQAGAAARVLRRDPEQADRALDAVQATGRAAVDDLRRMLGLLRGPGDGHSLAPQPRLEALDELAVTVSESGTPVEIERDETLELPAGLELAAYRIVQEAVTNAAKHAPGRPTRVRVARQAGALTIEARTTAPPAANGQGPGTGHGLIGMRERVAVYGGRLDAGRDERSDWVVSASIPLDGK